MASFSMLPAEQDVFAVWRGDVPSLHELRVLKACVPEINGASVTELYRQAAGRPEFHVGRFAYLRALEVRRTCEGRGLTVRLE